SKGGKFTCGPMWDFNLSYGNADYCDAYKTIGWQYNFADICENRFDVMPPNWWARLLEDKAFADSLKCRWIDLRSTILSTNAINHWIDNTALYLAEAQERNFTKWPILGEYVNWNHFIGNTFQEEVDRLKWWFKIRSEYLDVKLPGSCVNDPPPELEDSPEEEITLYPNPTSDFLLSNSPIEANADIQILSLEGKQVEFKVLDNKIDLSHLPQGLYLVRVNNQYIRVAKM
ncbi:MAG: T9SS type A sorting domain-containing protein, partial [Chitinophagales bacterium]